MVFGSQEEIIAPHPVQLMEAPPNHPAPEQGQDFASSCSCLESAARFSLQQDRRWKSSLFLRENNNRGTAAVRSIIHKSKGRKG